MNEENSTKQRLISIVIPAYNEQNNIEPVYNAVRDVFEQLPDYEFEIIFCDNHSTDETFQRVADIASRDVRVRVVRFARNFGFNRSVLTGYRLASGDAAIQLDCDLQDPPELFPTFITLWEQGHDVVVGTRRNRQESWLLQSTRKAFYRILQWTSDDNIMLDGGDFRLVDKTILDFLRSVDDADPYTRVLTSLMASNQIGTPYDRRVREADESKYPIPRLFGLACEGMIAHSIAPLRLASVFGIIVAMLCVLTGLAYVILKILGINDGPQGFTTTAVLILLGIGLNAIFLGIIGEYLGRIYNQLRRRPTTVLEASINFHELGDTANPSEPWRLWMPIVGGDTRSPDPDKLHV